MANQSAVMNQRIINRLSERLHVEVQDGWGGRKEFSPPPYPTSFALYVDAMLSSTTLVVVGALE